MTSSNQDVQRIFSALIRDPSTALDNISQAEQLPAEERLHLAGLIENHMLQHLPTSQELRQMRETISEMEFLRKVGNADEIQDLNGALKTYMGLSQIFCFAADNKGKAASHMVKIYAKAAAKLSDAEYGLTENHLKLVAATAEEMLASKQTPAAPQPNPFRKNK